MFGSGHGVWKSYCVVPCLLLLGAFSGCSFAYAAPTAEQSAIIAEQTKVIEANPKDYKAYFRRARAYRDADMVREAIEDCNRGIAINGKSQHLWVLLSGLLFSQKDYKGALHASKRAQECGPFNVFIGGIEVGCLRLLGQNQRCFNRCEELISKCPNYADYYFFRSSARAGLGGDRVKVIQDLKVAIKLDPTNQTYKHELELLLK